MESGGIRLRTGGERAGGFLRSAPTGRQITNGLMDQTQKTVRVQELRPGMVIREITELSFDYATLDPKTVQFLQSNFKGAKAVVMKDSGRQSIPISDLKPFDNLRAITDLPPTLKIASVAPGLAQSMEKRGFLEFKVVIPAKGAVEEAPTPEKAPARVGSAEAKAQHQQRVNEAKKLIEKVELANERREQSSSLVEEMLDQGRAGEYSTQPAERAVEEIISQGASGAMKAVAGLRGSDQTYTHCVDMSVIFQDAYAEILHRTGKQTNDEVNRFNLIAGFMHDIGKSEVPKEILDSTVRFAPDSKEMLILRNHTTYGAKILQELGMHKAQINVAHYHHVKRDSTLFTSYPDVPYDEVLPLTRLASITDVYQALIGKRRYKRNWVPAKAIEYLLKLRGSEFDERMLDHFVRSVGRYPVGSLLRLSNGSLAFVLRIAPDEEPERPVVAVVENERGELLSHQTLIDLMMEPELSVKEVVDHYEHYNQSEDQAYEIFRSIRVG
jgi:HD-GYP domain-containing protein (c-di-GMP phosphodiesterase class II)